MLFEQLDGGEELRQTLGEFDGLILERGTRRSAKYSGTEAARDNVNLCVRQSIRNSKPLPTVRLTRHPLFVICNMSIESGLCIRNISCLFGPTAKQHIPITVVTSSSERQIQVS